METSPRRRPEIGAWRSRPTGPAVLGAIAIATYVAIGLLTLARMPIVWLDEPWYTQPAWSFVTNGSFGMPMFAGLHGLDQDNVAFGRIYLGGIAVSFKLLGLGPFQARLPSFVAGLAVIYLTYLLGRRLWNARAGVFAAIALAVSPVFLMQTHDARPEILLLAFLLASLYLAVRSDAKLGIRGHIGAGVIAGLAADIHLNGLLVPFVLLVFVAVRTGHQPILMRRGAAILVGTLLGWMWWGMVHVLPNPALFVDQWSSGLSGVLPIQLLGADLRTVLMAEPLRFLQATLRWWPLAWLMPLGAILGGVILVRHHRDGNALGVLGGIAAMILFMALIVARKAPTYAVLVWPLGALLVGRWLTVAVGRAASIRILVATSLASVFALAVVGASQWQGNYDRFVGQLRNYIPAGATIQGEPTYWYGLADHPYIANQYFGRDAPYAETVRRLGIEYIIADGYFLDTILKVERTVSEAEVQDFLAHHADLVVELQDPQYGHAGWGASSEYQSSAYESAVHTTRIYRVRP
jgi:4-amino-4-deoxy-L-arabinose transferase-like glycosyltransferase